MRREEERVVVVVEAQKGKFGEQKREGKKWGLLDSQQ